MSRVLFRASKSHIINKNNSTEFSFKALSSEFRFHTNSGLSLPSFEQPSPVKQEKAISELLDVISLISFLVIA